MKQLLLFLCIVLLATGCSDAAMTSTQKSESLTSPMRGRIIVIDPGHGGIDHGAVSVTGAKEDELNLKVSLLVCAELKKYGVGVVLTRNCAVVDYSGDEATKKKRDMANRAEMIQGCQPDAVISIHMNKSTNKKYFGPQTYYKKGDDAGRQLASDIQDQLLGALPSYKRYRIIEGNFFILNSTKAPCVLIECGFLSNKEDDKRLRDEKTQQAIAKSICDGLYQYFSSRVRILPIESASGE